MGINLPLNMYSGQQIIIDGKALELPMDPPASGAGATLMSERAVNSIEIATGTGQLAFEGPMRATVLDHRVYKNDVYYIRIAFTPDCGLLTETHLKLKIRQVIDGNAADALPEQPELNKPEGH